MAINPNQNQNIDPKAGHKIGFLILILIIIVSVGSVYAYINRDTFYDNGLTNSDGGTGNRTLRNGISLSDNLKDHHEVKAYYVDVKKVTENSSIIVRSKKYPLFVTLFAEDGSIIAVSRDVDQNGDYIINHDFNSSEKYVVEVFVRTTQIENFDPNNSYSTDYTIGYFVNK